MTKQTNRLPQGGRIDRTKPLNFTFNGRRYQGYHGDTVASALLANGVMLTGRSWKYRRPRGIVSCGAGEPNALLQLERGAHTVPNARATEVELYDGLSAGSVNGGSRAAFDPASAARLFPRLMPAGFYYKTFMWPQRMWMKYEHFIRSASGLGESPDRPDPDRYDRMHAHCDVLVVGAGPAGLAAALAAGRTGARVIVADEQNEFGGSLLGSRDTIDGVPAAAWIADTVAELAGMDEMRMLQRATAFGYHDQNFITINQRLTDHLPIGARYGPRERVWQVRAKEVVLATGAIERPLVFSNNDRPGIILASAVSTYVSRYAVSPGSRAVIFTNNDGAYRAALDLLAAGVTIAAIVDARDAVHGTLSDRLRGAGVEIVAGSAVIDVDGRTRVQGARVMKLNGDTLTGRMRKINCDLIAMSGGWNPAVHLHSQSGGRIRFDESKACFVPDVSVQAQRSAGACNGAFGLAGCLAEGFAAGAEAAQRAGFGDGEAPAVPAVDTAIEQPLQPLWQVPSPKPVNRAPKQFVDLQNDVTAADIVLAAREGYRSIEHVKRYTALGFGTDQGKLGNINGAAILAETLGNGIAETGTTTFRPNYTPVTFGAIAGRDVADLFDPVRQTAMHQWHLQHGAAFENVGQWKRPWYYPKRGETMHDAVNRECLAVRNGVGIMDASTLGKIDIRGPDAAAFLDRVYTNAWSGLEVGRCRYGMMLDENGMAMDDGVTTRLAADHFLMTTTTGGAARVMAWLERWLQTEWPYLKVYLTSVTEHWATIAVAGPDSRNVLQRVCGDIDFSRDAFPFMSFREGTVAGVPARVMRISFSGELAYEINVNANVGRHVWDAVMDAGVSHGITPYGTEAMHALRAEKGFIIVGQDTDGSVTPVDLGMSWIVAKNKDCIGKRSLARSDTARQDRKQLVGLLTADPQQVLPEGAQIVAGDVLKPPVPMFGHVTSSYHSAHLGRSIALALIKSGRSRIGETVYVSLQDRNVPAVVASPVFFDRDGARQHV